MLRYLVERVMVMIPTLLAISMMIFIIIQLPPGNYVTNQIAELRAQGEIASAEKIEYLVAQYDLDKTVLEQYAIWIGVWPGNNGYSGLLQGNWGWSFEFNRPVADVVGEGFALTILLNLATVIFIYAVSFPIGVYSATRQYSWGDYGFTFLGYLGLAIPNFLLGLILLYYFNVYFGISIGGLMDPQYIDAPWTLAKVQSVLSHLIVPVIVIGTSGTAAMIRRLRANLLGRVTKAIRHHRPRQGPQRKSLADQIPAAHGVKPVHRGHWKLAAVLGVRLRHRVRCLEPAHHWPGPVKRAAIPRSLFGRIHTSLCGSVDRDWDACVRHPACRFRPPHPLG